MTGRPAGSDPQPPYPGHSVLQVPVPALEEFVRARTRHYDVDYLSADPRFGHAHVTALGPWLASPTAADLARVGGIAAATAPFDVVLDDLQAFPGGIVHLRPTPSAPFARLTAALAAAFPQCPPYDGRFAPVVPHLTLDHLTDGADGLDPVSVASTASLLGDVVPATDRAVRLDLAWYEARGCRVLASWALGGPDGVQVPDRWPAAQ